MKEALDDGIAQLHSRMYKMRIVDSVPGFKRLVKTDQNTLTVDRVLFSYPPSYSSLPLTPAPPTCCMKSLYSLLAV